MRSDGGEMGGGPDCSRGEGRGGQEWEERVGLQGNERRVRVGETIIMRVSSSSSKTRWKERWAWTYNTPMTKYSALPYPSETVLVRLPARLLELELRVRQRVDRLGEELVERSRPVDRSPGSDSGVQVEMGQVGVSGGRKDRRERQSRAERGASSTCSRDQARMMEGHPA